LTGTAQS
jgi:hypothetical protein